MLMRLSAWAVVVASVMENRTMEARMVMTMREAMTSGRVKALWGGMAGGANGFGELHIRPSYNIQDY